MTAALSRVTIDDPTCGAPLGWVLGFSTNPQPDGSVTLSYPDGSVLSVQPDGSWQTRPKGTAGAWEKAMIDGAFLTYCPAGARLFKYLFTPAVPNS